MSWRKYLWYPWMKWCSYFSLYVDWLIREMYFSAKLTQFMSTRASSGFITSRLLIGELFQYRMKWSYTECGFLSYLGSGFVLRVNYTSQFGKHIMRWLNHVFSLIKYRGRCQLRLKKWNTMVNSPLLHRKTQATPSTSYVDVVITHLLHLIWDIQLTR